MWRSVLLTLALLVCLFVGSHATLEPAQLEALEEVARALKVPFSSADACSGPFICSAGDVIHIMLTDEHTHGELSPKIKHFIGLQTLELRNCSLSGAIPDVFSDLPNLKLLSLEDNLFSGDFPSSLVGHSRLETLKLESNRLGGSLPPGIPGPLMTRLLLSRNTFHDDIPSFTSGKTLRQLDLSYNELTGPLPAEFVDPARTNLSIINFSHNKLSGRLPTSSSMKLAQVYLGDNQFSGSIPPAFVSGPNLVQLHLQNNLFTGNLPSPFHRMDMLDVSGNTGLNGPVPVSLENVVSLDLSNTNLELCKTSFKQSSPWTDSSSCDIAGRPICGCGAVWRNCRGGIGCSDKDCPTPKPHHTFYCLNPEWVSDEDVTLERGKNISFYGPAYVYGVLTVPSYVQLHGLDAVLTLTQDPDIGHLEAHLSEADLKKVSAAGNVRQLLLVGPGVGSLDTSAVFAPSCHKARSSVSIEAAYQQGDKMFLRVSLNYDGFWSACAAWTIPVHAVFHALILAAAIAFTIWTRCWS